MPPRAGYAILIGAGPTSGAGIARILAHPSHGNLAVALLARNASNLHSLTDSLRQTCPSGTLHAFPCDTSPANLQRTFREISEHDDFRGLKLKLAIYHVKHSMKKPYLETTPEEFNQSLSEYSTGAFSFGQEALRYMYAQNGGATSLSEDAEKKGTIIFTGTLGALRTNEGFNAYGAGRSAARMVAQGLGKEASRNGVHVVHTIANGGIRDVTVNGEFRDGESEDAKAVKEGRKMSAESMGKTYLWLSRMSTDMWIDECDLRPAQEKW